MQPEIRRGMFSKSLTDEWRHFEAVTDEILDAMPNGGYFAERWIAISFRLECALRKRAHARLRYSWVTKFHNGPECIRKQRLDEVTKDELRAEFEIARLMCMLDIYEADEWKAYYADRHPRQLAAQQQ